MPRITLDESYPEGGNMRQFFAFAALVLALSSTAALAVDVPIGSTSVDLVEGSFDASGELIATVDRSITFTEDGSADVWGTGTVTSNVFRQAGGNLLFQYTVHDVDFPEHDTSQWNLVSVTLNDFGTFATDVRGDTTGLVAARTDGSLLISTSDQIHNDHDIMIRTDATDFDQNGFLSIATTVIEPVFGSPSASATGLFQPVLGDGGGGGGGGGGTQIPLPAGAPAGAMLLGCAGAVRAWIRRRVRLQ